MNDAIQAFPLQWPVGWRRTSPELRERAKFGKKQPQYRTERDPVSGLSKQVRSYDLTVELTVRDATKRLLDELERMGMDRQDIVISTNIELRLDGLPKSNRRAPDDPGVAVYWSWHKGRGIETRCMAIDRYDRVEDNLAAVAATLDAMRAIDRHGGASILDRAFQGFTALAAPESWWQVLGLKGPNVSREDVQRAWRTLISEHHPDTGGNDDKAARINRARDQGFEAI